MTHSYEQKKSSEKVSEEMYTDILDSDFNITAFNMLKELQGNMGKELKEIKYSFYYEQNENTIKGEITKRIKFWTW